MLNTVLRRLALASQRTSLLDQVLINKSSFSVTFVTLSNNKRCLSNLNTIDVLELDTSGHANKSSKTPEDFRLIKESTGLPVRDLRLFFADGGGGFLPAVLARPSSKCFLLHLDALRLLCLRDQCLVMDPGNALVEAFAKEVREQLKEEEEEDLSEDTKMNASMSPSSSRMHIFLDSLSSNQQQNRSLEIIIMESALRVVSRKYRRQLNILKPMAEIMLQETEANPGAGALRRMLAFRKSLGAFESSVGAVRSAVSEVLGQRQDLHGLCLNNPESCEEMELLLEAYNADLKEILLELAKMKEQIEDTNDFISMHLDSMRNKIMRMSLYMEMGTLSAGAGAVVAGLFGMNLTSGLESHPDAFYLAAGGIFVLVGGLFGIFSRRFAVMNRDYSGAKGYLALKHFFQYVENLEEAVQRSQGEQGLREDEFRKLLEPLIDVHLTREEVGAIFRVLDENKDGILNVEDLSAALPHDKTT